MISFKEKKIFSVRAFGDDILQDEINVIANDDVEAREMGIGLISASWDDEGLDMFDIEYCEVELIAKAFYRHG